MGHTFTNLLSHIIFSTKNREPSIEPEMKPRLFSYIGGIIREIEGKALLINGTTDHVHLLVIIPANISVSDTLRVLKANSSRWIHENLTGMMNFGWQTGYGAFSVSQSQFDGVYKYIESQEEHHRRISFQEEFVAFLKKHKIEYDERYIWE